MTSKVDSLALTEAETRYVRKRVRWRLGLRDTKPPWDSRLGRSTQRLQRLHQLNELADTFVTTTPEDRPRARAELPSADDVRGILKGS